jgi:DNA-binding transcriptional MerR regulator
VLYDSVTFWLVDDSWTLSDLVAEAAAHLAALPPPRNGQVRAVPDERTIRYYAALGLLDRPAAMRGRTALYGRRHLAQVVAIKRMQGAGKSLAEIQALWSTLDDPTLERMSGVSLGARARSGRKEFWKRGASPGPVEPSLPPAPMPRPYVAPPPQLPLAQPIELRIELAPGAFLTVGVADGVSLSPADVHALRVAAAPLATELARRGLTAHTTGTLEEP